MPPKKDHKIKRAAGAHPAERAYAAAPPAKNPRPVVVDAHKFLDYCRLRAEAARAVEAIFQSHDHCALVGYLTGSVGPTVNARMIIEASTLGPVRFANDIKRWAPPGKTPEEAYSDTLDDLWNHGVRHFILADEYVGGGSINRALRLTWQWVRRRGYTTACFSIVAFAHAESTAGETDLREKVEEYRRCGMPICRARLLQCRRLLEMDKEGEIFNPVVKKHGHPGEYEFRRIQAPMYIKCPDGGASGGGGAYSADQLFGDLVERVIGAKSPIGSGGGLTAWPEMIVSSSCEECKGLLCRARTAWRA